MIKIRFIGDHPKKVKVFNEKTTVVTLTGTLILENKAIWQLPILDYLHESHNPEADFNIANDSIVLTVIGKAVKAEEDTFDPIVGERIAEARAKIRLYSFIKNFRGKYIQHCMETIMGKSPKGKPKRDWIEILSALETLPGSMMEDYIRYASLEEREEEHLKELLSKA